MLNNTAVKIHLSSFLSTVIQSLIYGVIYIVYIMCFLLILGNQRQIAEWIGVTVEIIVPIIGFIGYSFLILRKKIHFSIKNIISKYSVVRLFIRLLAVSLFLCLGYFASIPGVMPSFSGELLSTISTLAGNFSYYIIIAFFPITFAIIEYVFAEFEIK